MKVSEFYFDLPQQQIAQYPLPHRSSSRLLSYQRSNQQIEHTLFNQLDNYLAPGDLLVFNDSRVIPARCFGIKTTGGRVECLVERIVGATSALFHIKASKALKPGAEVSILTTEGDFSGWKIQVISRDVDLFYCTIIQSPEDMLCTFWHLLQQVGHMPLPPYIQRQDEKLDNERYQTIYARHDGSVAAPTAGLHFDASLFAKLHEKGIRTAFVTLHVGAGTFRPVRSERIQDHVMHAEQMILSFETCQLVNETKARGNRVIAVGTTALRCLESASSADGKLHPTEKDTSIFIYPGYSFTCCNGLITNFHLPGSTLLMLISAFIGHEQVMSLYQLAVQQNYRFFSYGDACLFL